MYYFLKTSISIYQDVIKWVYVHMRKLSSYFFSISPRQVASFPLSVEILGSTFISSRSCKVIPSSTHLPQTPACTLLLSLLTFVGEIFRTIIAASHGVRRKNEGWWVYINFVTIKRSLPNILVNRERDYFSVLSLHCNYQSNKSYDSYYRYN